MYRKPTLFRVSSVSRGFSLIELMAVMGVMAILLTVGAPGLVNLIKDNRLLSEVYALRATLNNARTEALTQRSFVTVCNSSDGASCTGNWSEGYIAFTDFNGNGTLDPNGPTGDRIIQSKVLDTDNIVITYSGAVNPRVRFDSSGNALNFSGTLTVCDDRGVDKARGVAVTNLGSVRSLVDTDTPRDEIVNLVGGSNVTCP